MHHTIFYDGVCGLCNRLNRFLLARDSADKLRFAALQGQFAQATLQRHGKDARKLDTLYVLSAEGMLLERSQAVLFLLRELGGVWRWVALLRLLPTFLLDLAYRLVARSRYRLFGKYDACPIPDPKHRTKFIPDEASPPQS